MKPRRIRFSVFGLMIAVALFAGAFALIRREAPKWRAIHQVRESVLRIAAQRPGVPVRWSCRDIEWVEIAGNGEGCYVVWMISTSPGPPWEAMARVEAGRVAWCGVEEANLEIGATGQVTHRGPPPLPPGTVRVGGGAEAGNVGVGR